MIHIHAISFAPKPPRADTRRKQKQRAEIHSQLRKELDRKPKRRKPYPITYSHS